MFLFLFIFLLISNAVSLRQDKSILFSRITVLGLCALLGLNFLIIKYFFNSLGFFLFSSFLAGWLALFSLYFWSIYHDKKLPGLKPLLLVFASAVAISIGIKTFLYFLDMHSLLMSILPDFAAYLAGFSLGFNVMHVNLDAGSELSTLNSDTGRGLMPLNFASGRGFWDVVSNSAPGRSNQAGAPPVATTATTVPPVANTATTATTVPPVANTATTVPPVANTAATVPPVANTAATVPPVAASTVPPVVASGSGRRYANIAPRTFSQADYVPLNPNFYFIKVLADNNGVPHEVLLSFDLRTPQSLALDLEKNCRFFYDKGIKSHRTDGVKLSDLGIVRGTPVFDRLLHVFHEDSPICNNFGAKLRVHNSASQLLWSPSTHHSSLGNKVMVELYKING